MDKTQKSVVKYGEKIEKMPYLMHAGRVIFASAFIVSAWTEYHGFGVAAEELRPKLGFFANQAKYIIGLGIVMKLFGGIFFIFNTYLGALLLVSKLHGIGSGYAEAEAFGNEETSFSKNIGSGPLPTLNRPLPQRFEKALFRNRDSLTIPSVSERIRFRFRFRSENRSSTGDSVQRSLLIYQAILSPILYDFYNRDYDKDHFSIFYTKFKAFVNETMSADDGVAMSLYNSMVNEEAQQKFCDQLNEIAKLAISNPLFTPSEFNTLFMRFSKGVGMVAALVFFIAMKHKHDEMLKKPSKKHKTH